MSLYVVQAGHTIDAGDSDPVLSELVSPGLIV